MTSEAATAEDRGACAASAAYTPQS
jgi:hypothetical protein